MAISENTKRKNQIVAQRGAEKTLREYNASDQSETLLWAFVTTVLEETVKMRGWSGHYEKACRAAMALKAARELKNRGTVLQLPLDDATARHTRPPA